MDAPCFGESTPGITWSAEAVSGSLPAENKKEWHSLAPASTKFEKQRIAQYSIIKQPKMDVQRMLCLDIWCIPV